MEVMGDLAAGLVVSGYSPDRVIEAIASKDPRRIYVAVQFHPEYVRSLAWASGIFGYVVEGAARDAAIDRALFESFRQDILTWLWQCARALHALRTTGTAGALDGSDGRANAERRTDGLQQEHAVAVPAG